MQNDYRRLVLTVLRPKRHHEVPDILDHSADDNVVFSQLRVLHRFKTNVFLIDWFGQRLLEVEPVATLDIIDVDIEVIVLGKAVELGSNHFPVFIVQTLKVLFILLVVDVVVVFENGSSVFHVISDEVTVVGVNCVA